MPESSLNVVSWNILLDKTRTALGTVKPQAERIPSQVATLSGLSRDLDVVMIQEAEKENGERLARSLGHGAGYWEQHHRKSERIGVFGGAVEHADFYDIGHSRKAVVCRVGGLAVVGVHLSARPKNVFKRAAQAVELCGLVEDCEETIILGDLNGPWFEPARQLLSRKGFSSAFHETGQRNPSTYPAEPYRDVMWPPLVQRALPRGISIDAVLVRGVDVLGAETFIGESDHRGLITEVRK